MTVEDIKKIKYGTFHTVSWQRPMKVRAAYRGVNRKTQRRFWVARRLQL